LYYLDLKLGVLRWKEKAFENKILTEVFQSLRYDVIGESRKLCIWEVRCLYLFSNMCSLLRKLGSQGLRAGICLCHLMTRRNSQSLCRFWWIIMVVIAD
jgi:hypothetical protein